MDVSERAVLIKSKVYIGGEKQHGASLVMHLA